MKEPSMALQHETVSLGTRQHSRAAKREAGFRTHLAVYLGVGAFLFTLNLLTSPFHLWFYWPMFFWGWGLVAHAFVTYGTDAPARVPDVARSLVPRLGDAPSAARTETIPVAHAAPFAAEAFAAVHERIERLKESSWSIDDADVRGQVEVFWAGAEQIVAAMARERADANAVRRFDAEYLAPVASLLSQYLDAARTGVTGADRAVRRIAEHDLPLALSRLDAVIAVDAGAA
jgi:hypothetical protein